ncbi:DUF1636 family protein [Hylemonella sp. W303a]|uniref:DUF1636 family protein n=1 Tax=Hylemonella sp. W303a TaxID=3389873 RepID=UPI00396B2D65
MTATPSPEPSLSGRLTPNTSLNAGAQGAIHAASATTTMTKVTDTTRATPTSATEIVVCTTCRPAGVPRDQTAPGQLLYEAVQAALALGAAGQGDAGLGAQTTAASAAGSTPGLKLRGLACMSGCDRACTVALQAPGKFSYYFGDLSADVETAAQLIACAQLHQASTDGTLLRNARPERLRSGILARLPAVEPATP